MTLIHAPAAQPHWQPQQSGVTERLRGVRAVNGEVAWACGNHGTVLLTTDGGATWQSRDVPGAEDLDFRDVEAFDNRSACVLSVGEGDKSRIYKTEDSGQSWRLVFLNAEPKAFFDAIAFWDARHGLAMSDPVDGQFRILATRDRGATWQPMPPEGMPAALPGEAAFAASGACLVAQGRRNAWFATGGAVARVFHSADGGRTWQVTATPVRCASEMGGISALAFRDARHGVAVGGDYKHPDVAADNIATTADGGRTWTQGTPPPGYRSCIAYLPGSQALIAVGLTGSDLSSDGGVTWRSLGPTGYHAVSAAAGGVWAVGEGGRIAKLIPGSPYSSEQENADDTPVGR